MSGAVNCLETRLQLLAAAAAAYTRSIDSRCNGQALTLESGNRSSRVARGQLHALVLLVQQLQGAPAPQRSRFLHSPAGSAVLWALSSLCRPPGGDGCRAQLMVIGDPLGAHAAQQQQPAGASDQDFDMTGPDLVQLLLLPGLLLQPMPMGQPCAKAAGTGDSSNASSSSSGSGMVVQSAPDQGPCTPAAVAGRTVVLSSEQGEQHCLAAVAPTRWLSDLCIVDGYQNLHTHTM
jgi:hypothetical protein